VLEIPAPALAPTENRSGKLYATLDVLGLAYNADGAVAARFAIRRDMTSTTASSSTSSCASRCTTNTS
jgi:hypothetical protein